MQKQSYIYILSNRKNGTLYVGITSDLTKRVHQHKEKLIKGFTQRHGIDKLVHYEVFDDIQNAIEREKYIKGKKRQFKVDPTHRMTCA